jgi:hypothetical protein
MVKIPIEIKKERAARPPVHLIFSDHLFQIAGRDGCLDLADGLRYLDLARASHGAIKNGMAAMDAVNLV